MKKLLLIGLILAAFAAVSPLLAQDPAPQTPSPEEVEKQKAELEKNGYRLLDQVINEAQSLRLPENRVRTQINAADLLWDHNQERARSLYAQAGDSVAEMLRNPPAVNNPRGVPQQDRRGFALRQELVLSAARHDAPLAYQLLAATKTAPQSQPVDTPNVRPQFNSDDNLEAQILGRIAALDPKLAAQNAEQMMEKGQFPRTIGEVINQLHKQDPEAAAKLADKTVKRIQAANLLTNNEAAGLAQALISAGPKLPVPSGTPTATDDKSQAQSARRPALEPSAYTDLLSAVIDAALKAVPQSQNSQRGGGQGLRAQPGGPGRGPNAQPQNPTPPSDAQLEQNGARRLLGGLQAALPSIDQYLPSRATAVRQKLAELGLSDTRSNFAQTMNSLQQSTPTAEALVQAAASAPPPMQSRMYQQAAYRAIEEGNTDRARQIATDHLQAGARDSVLQRIDFREMVKKSEGVRLDEVRQSLARFTSDSDKISVLLQLANDLQKDNPKAQLQLLEEAHQVVNHRAANYSQFEDQLRVAHAFSTVDPTKGFEVLEPGISQLNELLSAAAVLSGFETNVFRDGEMGPGSGLSSTISRYGQELSVLAKSDFGRAETLAGRFQFTEARIMARMSIIQGALGIQSNVTRNFGSVAVRPPQ